MKVSLPTLNVIKDENERLQNAYKIIMQITFFISAAGLGIANLIISPIVMILMGKQWLSLVPIFQILSISFIFYPLHSLNINILSLFGRSDLFLRLEIVKKVIVVVLILIGFKFGVFGLVWSNVLGSILALGINSYYSSHFLNYSTKNQIFDLVPTILVVIFTVLLVFLFKTAVSVQSPVLSIILNSILGVVSLIIISNLFKLYPYLQLKKIVLTFFEK